MVNDINFLRGLPADDVLEWILPTITRRYKDALQAYGVEILQYQFKDVADFNGFIPLKMALAERYGVKGDPNQRLICFNGSIEAFSMLLKCLPVGSVIATEALTYDRALANATYHDHQVIGIPFDGNNVDTSALEKTLTTHPVRLFYQVIYHQNPTGYMPDMDNIHCVAEICAAHDVPYVCDIAYYELKYEGPPNKLPNLERFHDTMCLIGSFTKTISPGTKCGFGVFPEAITAKLSSVVANSRLNPNYPTQAMIYQMIASGDYDDLLDHIVGVYLPKARAFNKAIATHLPDAVTPYVKGGFFTGIWLPGISDEQQFITLAKEHGVNISEAHVFAPGWKEHYFEKYGGHFFRLTFPVLSVDEIQTGVARLGEAYRAAVN
jgi:2-aminoadipate transaminase